MAKRPFIPSPSASDSGLDSLNVNPLGEKSRTLIERAYLQLRKDIIDGELLPNEKLRVEHLKDRYAVGAGTLREAMSRLVSDALIVAEGQRGFRVAPITMADLEDITNTRIHLEIEGLRHSIRNGGQSWREKLKVIYDELTSIEQPIVPERMEEWESLNARFHSTLIEGHGSAWTLKLLEMLSRHSERYRRYSIGLDQKGRDVHAEHEDIFINAIAGNELRAALALESHVRATYELLKKSLFNGTDVFSR